MSEDIYVEAVYLCDPPEGHHWVHQQSLEGVWVGKCSMCPTMTVDLAMVRERLRAQVEALRDEYDESPYPYTHNALNRVLALLDGEPNG
jgi:hypothetical protein